VQTPHTKTAHNQAHVKKDETCYKIAQTAKLSDIASYIGVTQQSLSRIRQNITWGKNELKLKSLNNELELRHSL
jgi:hypothetical protein